MLDWTAYAACCFLCGRNYKEDFERPIRPMVMLLTHLPDGGVEPSHVAFCSVGHAITWLQTLKQQSGVA